MTTKTCKKCSVDKSLTDYHKDSKAKDQHNSICKTCANQKFQDYCNRDRGKVKAQWRKSANKNYLINHRLRKYNLSDNDFKQMLEIQNNKCAICFVEFTKVPCVDHDHATGRVRSLLCRMCNVGIGAFRDNPVLLARAIAYLKQNM